jgi:hypothetical protein
LSEDNKLESYTKVALTGIIKSIEFWKRISALFLAVALIEIVIILVLLMGK